MTKRLLELLEKIHDGKVNYWRLYDYCFKNNIELVEYENGLGIGDDFVTYAYLNGEDDLMNNADIDIR